MLTPSVPEIDYAAQMREARNEVLKAAIGAADVEATLIDYLKKALSDRTNPLTRALHDTAQNPCEDRLELNIYVQYLPYRLLAEIGREWLRAVGESWLTCAQRIEERPF